MERVTRIDVERGATHHNRQEPKSGTGAVQEVAMSGTGREPYRTPALDPAGRLEPRLQGSPPEPPPWP